VTIFDQYLRNGARLRRSYYETLLGTRMCSIEASFGLSYTVFEGNLGISKNKDIFL